MEIMEIVEILLILIVVFAYLYSMLYMLTHGIKLLIIGSRANAKVIEICEENFADEETSYYPIIQFTDKDGIDITLPLDTSSSPEELNKTIEIIYLKKGNKYDMKEKSIFQLIILPIIYLVFPGILIYLIFSI